MAKLYGAIFFCLLTIWRIVVVMIYAGIPRMQGECKNWVELLLIPNLYCGFQKQSANN